MTCVELVTVFKLSDKPGVLSGTGSLVYHPDAIIALAKFGIKLVFFTLHDIENPGNRFGVGVQIPQIFMFLKKSLFCCRFTGNTDKLHKNNSIFCSKFDENNSELDRKIIDIKKKLNNGLPTVPSSIKDELDCNIFLRAKTLKEFSKLRDLKDNF